jgi:DNA repair exonuclease SbcCD ATPase subunit
MNESYWRIVVTAFTEATQEKEVAKMRRIGVLIISVCFILAGFQVAFSQEQKEQKGEYQKKMETKLKDFKQKLEELKGKAGELKQEVKEEFNQGVKELEKKEEAANRKFKELKSSGAKTWEKIKAEMDKAADELEKQYDKVKSHFKKT